MNDGITLGDIQRMRALRIKSKEIREKRNDFLIRHWRDLAGPVVDLMLQDRDFTFAQLTSALASIRHAALPILTHHWRLSKDHAFVQQCEEMAFNDLDDTVRSVALRSLGQSYENTDDIRIGKLLAEVTRDERQPTVCRTGAYLALFQLRGRFADWPGRKSTPHNPFQFPEHVDWTFVDSFFDETRVFEKAVPQLFSYLTKETIEALPYYQKGIEALKKGEYETAVRCFSDAVMCNPEAAGAYGMRARAYVELGWLNEAIGDFTKAIELNPHLADPYHERGKAYTLLCLHDLAEQDYRRAHELQ